MAELPEAELWRQLYKKASMLRPTPSSFSGIPADAGSMAEGPAALLRPSGFGAVPPGTAPAPGGWLPPAPAAPGVPPPGTWLPPGTGGVDPYAKVASDTMKWQGRVPPGMASGMGAAPVAPSPVGAPPSAAYKVGHATAEFMKGPWGSRLPGLGVLAEGALGPDGQPVTNAIRTGVGLGAMVNPAVGGPLAVGMGTASLIGDVADRVFQPGQSNILAPEFSRAVTAAGGVDAYTNAMRAKVLEQAPAPQVGDAGLKFGAGSPPMQGAIPAAAPAQTWNNQPYQKLTSTPDVDANGNPTGNFTYTGSGNAQGYGSDQARAQGYGAVPSRGGYADIIKLGMMVGDRKRAAANDLAIAKGEPAARLADAKARQEDYVTQMSARMFDPRTPEDERARIGQALAGLHGRFAPKDNMVVVPGFGMGDPAQVINKDKMTATKVVARSVATEQTIKDTLATNPGLKGDRAAAIKALRDTGRYDVTGLR